MTATLYIGRKLWQGSEIYVDPEMSGGNGFSSTKGVAGFPNGEVYRVDDMKPKVFLARSFLRQHFSLGESERESVPPDQNQLAGVLPVSRLTVSVGKFSLTDIFDDNAYSHDPRTQFMNWSLWAAGAWDYAADTRGYTWGLAAELRQSRWKLSLAAVLVPSTANGPEFDTHLSKAYSFNLEFVTRYHITEREGRLHLIGFWNHAHMGNYRVAIDQAIATGQQPDITLSRTYSSKFGLALGLEQPFSETVGMFCRFSWNDGVNETWAFTEIDRSIHLGLSIRGDAWKRAGDNVGVAWAANALSQGHREYLALGGYGFIIGDAISRIVLNISWNVITVSNSLHSSG